MSTNSIKQSRKTRLLKKLVDASSTSKHELIEECLNYYNVYGVQELSEKQVEDFCRRKGLVSTVKENGLLKSVREIIEEVTEDICDNYCKYRDTSDDDFLCDAIRDGGSCPLDRLQ